MRIICVIPARYQSSRLPGKPMKSIAGFPMIQWTYTRARLANVFDRVIVATDHREIFEFVHKIGGESVMTPAELASGTDRVAYVAKELEAHVFVNLQGDEPLISPVLLKQVCMPYQDPQTQITTAISKITNSADLQNPAVVKVVHNKNSEAMYFSRSAIPFIRDEMKNTQKILEHTFYRHIGIYTYRKEVLEAVAALPESGLEKAEKLEQLRFIEAGYKIRTVITDYESISVDTQNDLAKINLFVKKNKISPEI